MSWPLTRGVLKGRPSLWPLHCYKRSRAPAIATGWVEKKKDTLQRSQEYLTMPLTCVIAIVRGIKDVSVVELPIELQPLDQFLHKVIN